MYTEVSEQVCEGAVSVQLQNVPLSHTYCGSYHLSFYSFGFAHKQDGKTMQSLNRLLRYLLFTLQTRLERLSKTLYPRNYLKRYKITFSPQC